MALEDDIKELEAYSNKGPAVSRATCGRLAATMRLLLAFDSSSALPNYYDHVTRAMHLDKAVWDAQATREGEG